MLKYLDTVCETLDKAGDRNNEIYFMGDLNIDALNQNCPMWKKLCSIAKTCNMTQVVSAPTRIFTNKYGKNTSTCIDRIFINTPAKCSKAVSVPLGFSDHNWLQLKE